MNIISQNFKNVLKIRIKTLITPNLYNFIDLLIDNFYSSTNDSLKYFDFFSMVQESTRKYIKSIIISTFEEFDKDFKNSYQRKSRYYINKSNVPRTIITIVGEITFYRTYYISKYSKNKFFYVDNVFDLPKNDHYDPIVKAIAIYNAINTSQAQAARDLSATIGSLTFFLGKSTLTISRQSVFNWIKKWKVPNIVPKSVSTPETLYVMADEKYIGAQDIDKDIMVKCFVTFEDVKAISKNRNKLVNRFVYSTYSSKPWISFMDLIAMRYDFTKLKEICLLGDGASWIKSGTNELRLDSSNHVKFYLCEFHFKQAIHHITSDKEERNRLINIFNTKGKEEFRKAVKEIIIKEPTREEKITKKLDYIMNNYYSIKAMLELKIGSSMESHISHLIASFFSSRPKGYSTKRINQYLKLNDYKNNNINIFKLYAQSYKNTKEITINENNLDFSVLENNIKGNIPILNEGIVYQTYWKLNNLAHN
jgi:hypothetical protein